MSYAFRLCIYDEDVIKTRYILLYSEDIHPHSFFFQRVTTNIVFFSSDPFPWGANPSPSSGGHASGARVMAAWESGTVLVMRYVVISAAGGRRRYFRLWG